MTCRHNQIKFWLRLCNDQAPRKTYQYIISGNALAHSHNDVFLVLFSIRNIFLQALWTQVIGICGLMIRLSHLHQIFFLRYMGQFDVIACGTYHDSVLH